MRFTRIEAIGVGPLRDRHLDLAPGLNVVHGANEAGKSSWLAALVAGWLGLRRGRGASRGDVRDFVERHQPWSGEPLRAAVRLETHDGRGYRFWRDLTDLADNEVTDGSNAVVTGDWLHEGTADGARVLGLTRDVARATIIVGQADVLGVRTAASGLQEQLQRAAAAADRGGATAAGALERLAAFQRQHVGVDRRNAVGPLRRAIVRLEEAEEVFREASARHEEHLDLVGQRDVAAAEVEELATTIGALAASGAVVGPDDATTVVGDGPPTIGDAGTQPSARLEAIAEVVDRVRQRYADSPAPAAVDGDSVAALESALAELPEMPDGDLQVHASVAEAREERTRARQRLDSHRERRPVEAVPPDLGELAPPDLDRYAGTIGAALDAGVTVVGDTPDDRPAPEVSAGREAARARDARTLWLVAGVLVLVGIGGLVASAAPVAAGGLVGALLAAAGAVLRVRRAGAEPADPAERGAGPVDEQLRDAVAQAHRELARAGIVWEAPADLRDLAERAREAQRQATALAEWCTADARHVEELARADDRLRAALIARGARVGEVVAAEAGGVGTTDDNQRDEAGAGSIDHIDVEDLDVAYVAYERACHERQRLATEASRRPDLEGRLTAARHLAATRARAAEQHERAVGVLLAQAHALGFGGDDVGVADAFLKDWRERQRRVVEDLRAAEQRFARLTGQVAESERRAGIPVAEAEEERDRARDELARVRDLDAVLDATVRHLRDASQRVNQDIAPVLQEAVAAHLPRLTRGRYDDVRIDPRELTVSVRTDGGVYREAERLSHGAAEQIYLLLRIGLAEHLVVNGEVAPLVFDDVTVQFDEHRTAAFLDLCLDLAADRQIVLFTQEREVLEWAQHHLADDPRHRLHRLDDPVLAGGVAPESALGSPVVAERAAADAAAPAAARRFVDDVDVVDADDRLFVDAGLAEAGGRLMPSRGRAGGKRVSERRQAGGTRVADDDQMTADEPERRPVAEPLTIW